MHKKSNKRPGPGVPRLAWLVLLPGLVSGAQENHPVTMWMLEGEENRIYLLGSVHLLRADDHPLPAVIDEVYDDAEILVMELDMDDIDPVEAQSLVAELGLIQDDSSLADLMGPERYAEAEALAEISDIPLSMLSQSEPWLAAITVEQLMLARVGFNPIFGIENHLMEQATVDDKEILGLETVREQLDFLDGMSLESQRSLLLQSLKESVDVQEIMDELVDAWRHGDVGFMEDNILLEIRRYPELYQTIVVKRNLSWVEKIEELLDDREDYLIIVGALHLIGEDGVPRLLEKRGLEVVQMRESAQ